MSNQWYNLLASVSRRVCGFVMKFEAQAWTKQPQAQILVVVASIQLGPLKTGVGDGFM